MARAASLKNESFMHKARTGVKCSHSVMSPCTKLWVGQMSVSFKGQKQAIEAALTAVWSLLLAEAPRTGASSRGLQSWRRGVSQRGVPVPWGQAQERAAGTLGSAPGSLHGTHVPTASPSPIIRALLIMLCKCWEMDFTFPPARLHTALHLLSPFKNTESSEKGNGSFLFVRQQSWHRPVKQSSWAVICKAALCCSIPPPPRLFTRHTQTSARLKTSYFLIRQNLSAWVMKMLQRLLTSHQINPELRPQHLVLIHVSGW